MNDRTMLNEDSIRERTTDTSFSRAVDFLEDGAVTSLIQRGSYIHAEVDGDAVRPFKVEIRLQGDQILWTRCSCGLQDVGDCRHVVSVLLTCARCPEDIEHRPSIEEQLAALSSGELRELWIELIEQKTNTIEWLEGHIPLVADARPAQVESVAVDTSNDEVEGDAHDAIGVGFAVPLTAAPMKLPKLRKQVDPEGIRWHVNACIHSLDRMRKEDAIKRIPEVLNDLRKVLKEALALIDAGEPNSALSMLEAMIDVWSEEWVVLDDESGASVDFWDELELPLAEAILSVNLNETERDEWYGLIDTWQDDVESYDLEIFPLALAALAEGWDDSELRQCLQKPLGDQVAAFGVYHNASRLEELSLLRLTVLKRAGRVEEYLHFAWAAGLIARWCTMMVEMGRIDEMFALGIPRITSPEDVVRIVRFLAESKRYEQALQVVESTWMLEGPARHELLALGRDLASSQERPALAIKLALASFQARPSLDAYQAVETIAGPDWSGHRTALLEVITNHPAPARECIEILLHEKMLDQAIQIADQCRDSVLIAQVVDALWALRPGWALGACKGELEPILDQGHSHLYASAITWLKKACDAAEAHGTLRDFKGYVEQLLVQHSRKHKLTPLLKELHAEVKKLAKKGRRSTRVLLAMKGLEATESNLEEVQHLQQDTEQPTDDAYTVFIDGLSEQARVFLDLLSSSGYLQASEAKESLGLDSDRQIGGLVGSIKRRANKCYVQPPYMTGLTDAGERFWRWIGRP